MKDFCSADFFDFGPKRYEAATTWATSLFFTFCLMNSKLFYSLGTCRIVQRKMTVMLLHTSRKQKGIIRATRNELNGARVEMKEIKSLQFISNIYKVVIKPSTQKNDFLLFLAFFVPKATG